MKKSSLLYGMALGAAVVCGWTAYAATRSLTPVPPASTLDPFTLDTAPTAAPAASTAAAASPAVIAQQGRPPFLPPPRTPFLPPP